MAAAPPMPPGSRRALAMAFRERVTHAASQVLTPALPIPAGVLQAPISPAPANNWIPIGPSVLRKGQAEDRPAVSGRVPGLAIAPGGSRVYVASANGGMWRSDDGGTHWRSTMDAFNLQPSSFLSDSLSCGAIALHPNDPDRIYIGTGEGDNLFVQGNNVQGTAAYFGVGPVRSDDGGSTWHTEAVKLGSPPLAGSAFYRLAVDPADGDRVIAATAAGLYRREPDATGAFVWAQKQRGIFTSVVAARRANVSTFYAVSWGGAMWTSSDGDRWASLPALPQRGAGRVALAVQPNNPDVLYALAARASDFHLLGLYRFDRGAAWKQVAGAPPDLFGPDLTKRGQGSYDMAIAVDPRDPNLLYLGGSTKNSGSQWSASLFRLAVQSAGGNYSGSATYIGTNVHADVHTLEFTPGNPEELWVGCDGGVFCCDDASSSATFAPRNTGLSTITMNRLALHPTEDAVLFCGTQDNGTVRYTGDEAWLHSGAGDGGSVVVNRVNPYSVLRTYVLGELERASDGGQSYNSWADVSVPLGGKEACSFYAPLAAAPTGAGNEMGNLVAFGSIRPWISTEFGDNWKSIPNDDLTADALDSEALSLVFASPDKFYVGTLGGGVYRCAQAEGAWSVTPIQASPLLQGPITGVTIDTADASGDSLYITLGGSGDYRHVWRYDGQSNMWEARSGPPADPSRNLMDVQHNAIVVDPANPAILYAAADIGIWKSTDSGSHWAPFAEGLPEAAVLDLNLHPTRRLLWAATYGRGVYERTADSATARAVELYLRDTQLDRGRYPSVDALPDPTQPGSKVSILHGPGIRIDAPNAAGAYQTTTAQIDFFQYIDALDDSPSLATGAGAINRVFVLVHNRGVMAADSVSAFLLIAPLQNGAAPALPNGFAAAAGAGTSIAGWTTIGTRTIAEVRVGSPEVVEFDVPSNLLPAATGQLPAWCLLALVNCAADPLVHPGGQTEAVAADERRIAIKYI